MNSKICIILILKIFFFAFFLHCHAEEISQLPSEKPYFVALQNIVLSENYEYLQSDALDESANVEIVDLWEPKKQGLEKCLEKFIGDHINEELLEKVKDAIVKYYNSHGCPLTKAIIFAGQDITEGSLRVFVSVNRVKDIQCRGAKHFSNERIASQIGLKKDDVIEINRLSNDLDWINQNPFRKTTLTLVPSGEFGKTDVILKTVDRYPLKVYTGYENTGNQVAGNSRFFAGVNFGNVFRRAHQWNNLFVSGADPHKYFSISSNYFIPTYWRGKFEFYGSFVRTKPDMEKEFNLIGKSWQVAGRYKQYFHRCLTIFFGYEFKRTNNFLTFSDQLVFDRFFDISQFLIGVDVNYKCKKANTFLGVIIYGSPGDMTAFNKDRIFTQERAGAISHYIYGKIRFEQLFYLPCDFILFFNGAFQQSTAKLLPSEEFSLGGFYTIRGYKENEAIGDNGFLLRTELRLPGIKKCRKEKLLQNLQFLGFVDFGYTYDVDKTLISKDTVFIASFGPGIRYFLLENLQVRFDYGFQLKTINRIDDPSRRSSRAHVGAVLSF